MEESIRIDIGDVVQLSGLPRALLYNHLRQRSFKGTSLPYPACSLGGPGYQIA